MDFVALRNNIEHFAAAVRRSEGYREPNGELAAGVFLTVGECLVGIFEELHGIREALDRLERREAARGHTIATGTPTFGDH